MSPASVPPAHNGATPAATERRVEARHACQLEGECQPITALEAGNHWPAKATDISCGGVSLRVSRRFEPGTILALQFAWQAVDAACTPFARVSHVSADNMHWRIGCKWARELSSEDLRPLLAAAGVQDQAA